MGDIRDDLSAAFKELSDAPAPDEQITDGDPPKDPAEPPEAKGKEIPPRDDSGKFAPKVEAKDPPADGKPVEKSAEGKPEEKPASPKPAARAPVSWTPQEREHWEKAPPEVQSAIMRREREITEALRISAGARQAQQAFDQLIHPYMPLIQQEGATPLGAVQKLLQTAAALRTAPAPQRAELVADMILRYGIDVEMLDTALSGKVKPGGQGDPAIRNLLQQFDSKLQPVTNFMQKFSQQQQQTEVEPLKKEIDDFMNDPANEFAQDVVGDMADLLMLAAQRGQVMTVQDAYKRAIMAHPEISKILETRKLGEKAAQQTAAARRAKDAAVSVSDSGAPSQNDEEPAGDDIRSALTAAIKQHSRTR